MSKDLKKSLNLNYLDLTNKTNKTGKYDFPCVECPAIYDLDYIALYKELKDYKKTENTAVAFYQYDNEFDGITGLGDAIWHNDTKKLELFKKGLVVANTLFLLIIHSVEILKTQKIFTEFLNQELFLYG